MIATLLQAKYRRQHNVKGNGKGNGVQIIQFKLKTTESLPFILNCLSQQTQQQKPRTLKEYIEQHKTAKTP